MHLEASDPTFLDAFLPSNAGRNDRLDRIDRLIDWPKVAALLDGVHAAPEGRPAYRPVTMVKIIVLQQWYDASDVGMEEALQDRLSFRRFAELTLTDAVPDHSTISRFRKKITERGLARALFAEVNRQLEAKGMLVKRGTLIDATIIEAQARRPQSEAGARSGTDPDAAWTKKGKRSHFGYKMHIGMDAGSGLIRGVEFTPANVADTEAADALIMGDEEAVYADKAYESKERRERLRAQGVKDRIMHRGHKHQSGLPHWQRRRNGLLSKVRAPVEQVFGTLKHCYGYWRVRCMGLRRNEAEALFKALGCNLRRADGLRGGCAAYG